MHGFVRRLFELVPDNIIDPSQNRSDPFYRGSNISFLLVQPVRRLPRPQARRQSNQAQVKSKVLAEAGTILRPTYIQMLRRKPLLTGFVLAYNIGTYTYVVDPPLSRFIRPADFFYAILHTGASYPAVFFAVRQTLQSVFRTIHSYRTPLFAKLQVYSGVLRSQRDTAGPGTPEATIVQYENSKHNTHGRI